MKAARAATTIVEENASSAEIETAFAKLGEREVAIRARIADIDAGWANGQIANSVEQQAAIRDEHARLYAELRQLAARVPVLLDAKEKALRREAPSKAAAARKGVEALLLSAESTKAAWIKAKAALNEHIGTLANQRQLARAGGIDTKKITEEQFVRAVAVLDLLPAAFEPGNIAHRSAADRVAMQRMSHFDEPFDLAKDLAWKQAGADQRQPSGYLAE